MLEFKNKDVAAKYSSTFKGDPVVHLPGGKNKNGFKKNLSTITLDEADRLFVVGKQNLLQLIDPTQESQKSKVVAKDYSNWGEKRLKKELEERKIEIPNGTDKDGMIKILEESDKLT